MKLLIVEDDRSLNPGIALSLNNWEVVQAFSLQEARQALSKELDLILLDVNLPDGSGLDFCKEVRAFSRIPIIMLTANDMELDIVTGLESGADDYITKPFSLAVLRARVNAVVRRGQDEGRVFREGDFVFDFEEMKFSCGGTPVTLSKTEQKLLKLLVQNRGRTMTRESLLDRVWSDGAEFVEENALSVCMKRLRQKLPGLPVKTVYGIGYVWEREV